MICRFTAMKQRFRWMMKNPFVGHSRTSCPAMSGVPQLVNWVTSLFASVRYFGLGTRPTLLRNGAKNEESHNGQTMDQFKVVKIDLCFRSKRLCFGAKNARESSCNPSNIEANVVQILYPLRRSLLHISATSKILHFSTCNRCIQ